jgi:hypothetical protein
MYKASSTNASRLSKNPYKRQENVLFKNRNFAKRNQTIMQGYESPNRFHIEAIPLLKREVHTRNRSMMTEKRHIIKLEEYYDRSFLIIQKSPPTVSGYSVTFYHK